MEKTEQFTPRSQHVDFNSRLRINELMNYLADFARRHAEEQNFGFHAMADQGLYWVLHGMQLEISRLPLLDQPLSSTTRAWFTRGLKAQRQFSLSPADPRSEENAPRTGSELIRAHSHWLLIHGQRKRPVPIHSQFEPQGGQMFDPREIPAIHDIPDTPDSAAPAEPDEQFSRTVAYSDVDVHQHINNSRYVALGLDALPVEVWKSPEPLRVDISFLKECFFGDEISVQRFSNSAGHLVLCLRDNEPVFRMKIVHHSL